MRAFALALGALAIPAAAAVAAEAGAFPAGVVWTDARTLTIQGRAWPESELLSPYDRMPAVAQKTLDADTWSLSETAIGMSTTFRTDAEDVYVRYNFSARGAESGDWLWPINGHSGADVYVASDALTNGTFRWATSSGNGCQKMSTTFAAHGTSYAACLEGAVNPAGENRTFTVYLPPRGQLESVEIGVVPPAALPVGVAPFPADKKPVLWYGTSIVHGAGTLHAGMHWTAQADRMLRRSGWNFGFSGDGLMQPEVGALLAQLDPAAFVLDCEFNMDRFAFDEVRARTLAFVRQLRATRPATPIVVAEGHPAGSRWIDAAVYGRQNETRAGYRAAFNALIQAGEAVDVYYLEGDGKFGGDFATDFEAQVGAVHGVHPSMFGMMHMAQWVSDFVATVLNGTAPAPAPLPLPPYPHSGAAAADRTTARARQSVAAAPRSATKPQAAPSSSSLVASAALASAPGSEAGSMVWTDGRDLGVEGKGWNASENPGPHFWRRLPDRAQQALKEQNVWFLSQATSGILVRFSTNATTVTINVTRDEATASGGFTTQDDIMSYNGRFGIDVYVRDQANKGAWRWAGTSGAGATQVQEQFVLEVDPTLPPGASRDFTVYLPTHVSLLDLQVGVPAGSAIGPYVPYSAAALAKPVAVWGSSIAQGGVVQNAGMTWPVALQRLLDAPLLNFGFSGSCQMQEDVAALLGELTPSLFLLDCLPNMNAAGVNASAVRVLKQLRAAFGPDVPIAVLEGHTYTNAWVVPQVKQGQDAKRAAQRAAVEEATAAGVENLHYVPGDGKLASLGEAQHSACGGAGVHPSNIAHLRIAEYVAAQVKPLLPATATAAAAADPAARRAR